MAFPFRVANCKTFRIRDKISETVLEESPFSFNPPETRKKLHCVSINSCVISRNCLLPNTGSIYADIMASTYGLPEMARMLGVHRQTIYYIVANEDFELIKVGRYKRATKESFEKWYHNQTRYQLAEDRQERS